MADPEPELPPRHPAWRIARQIAGWFFIILAIVGAIVPFIPHTPFLALGAILLAPYIKLFRRISAWIHKKYPRTRPHMRRFRIFKRPWKAAHRIKPEAPVDPVKPTDS